MMKMMITSETRRHWKCSCRVRYYVSAISIPLPPEEEDKEEKQKQQKQQQQQQNMLSDMGKQCYQTENMYMDQKVAFDGWALYKI